MKQKQNIKEEWIRLENDLAEELLNTGRKEREHKYREVYERMYQACSNEKKAEMSNHYLKTAIEHNTPLRKLIQTGKTVLDIGCGFGHECALLAQQDNQTIGIDINTMHIREAKERYGHLKNLNFFSTSGVKLAFPDNSFDFVISKSVFEHLHPNDVDEHLVEVKRVLRADGEYIFTAITPYKRGDVSAFSNDPEQKDKTGFHINIITWERLYTLLRAHGFKAQTNILPFKIVNSIPYFSFLIPLSFKPWLEKAIKMNRFNVKLFKLGGVFVRATVNRKSNTSSPGSQG
jgi:ubiquinone/menaquinone biosynthesis C-methylase UbiE